MYHTWCVRDALQRRDVYCGVDAREKCVSYGSKKTHVQKLHSVREGPFCGGPRHFAVNNGFECSYVLMLVKCDLLGLGILSMSNSTIGKVVPQDSHGSKDFLNFVHDLLDKVPVSRKLEVINVF